MAIIRRPGDHGRAKLARFASTLAVVLATTVVVVAVRPPGALATTVPVPLGTAAGFGALAGTTITNTGPTTINGDLGVSPGTAVTGFPPGQVNGVIHSNDAPAVQAQADLAIAYNDAVARTNTNTVAAELGGTTLTTGVYGSVSGTFDIASTVTLDAEGDPNAVFIFKAVSTLITGASSSVNLVNGAQSCNVFWQVGSSATLGANSTLRGSVLAFTSITVGAGLLVDGRTLAINGAVTMDTDTISTSTCAPPGELSISAPETADLGSGSPGGSVSANLGPVTVTDGRGLSVATWTATVSATNFVSGAGPGQTILNSNVSYWSGIATSTTGRGTFTSGQPSAADAQPINVSPTAYALTEGVGYNSATWDPTVVVAIPLSAVAGLYTATVTFSVG